MSNEEDKEFIGLDVEQIAKILELEKQYPFVRKPGKQPPTFVSADRANNFISRLKQFYYPGDLAILWKTRLRSQSFRTRSDC